MSSIIDDYNKLKSEWIKDGKAHLIESDSPEWWEAVRALRGIKKHRQPIDLTTRTPVESDTPRTPESLFSKMARFFRGDKV